MCAHRKLTCIQWRMFTRTVRDTKYHDDVLMDFVIHIVAQRETNPPQVESCTRIRRVVRSDVVPTNRSRHWTKMTPFKRLPLSTKSKPARVADSVNAGGTLEQNSL